MLTLTTSRMQTGRPHKERPVVTHKLSQAGMTITKAAGSSTGGSTCKKSRGLASTQRCRAAWRTAGARRHLEHEDGGRDELDDELDEDQGVVGLGKDLAEDGAAARGAPPCPSRFSRPLKLSATILSSSPARHKWWAGRAQGRGCRIIYPAPQEIGKKITLGKSGKPRRLRGGFMTIEASMHANGAGVFQDLSTGSLLRLKHPTVTVRQKSSIIEARLHGGAGPAICELSVDGPRQVKAKSACTPTYAAG